MENMYDLIIIGAGPAGIAASIYAARERLNFIIISKNIGGQVAATTDIENYPGFDRISGANLVERFEKHIKKYNMNYEQAKVIDIKKIKNGFSVIVDEGKKEYKSHAIIIASGKKPRRLGIPGEHKFLGKGVSYCATCDAPLFADKDVAVIGGGNSALIASLLLTKYANKIYMIVRSDISGEAMLKQRVRENNKIRIIKNAIAIKILGNKMVGGIKIKTGGMEKELKVQGVFVEIGLIPNSGFAGLVMLNKKAEIIVDKENRTNVPGIFAAGDVTDVAEKQIVIAAGEGSKAALSAINYLRVNK